jgi:hypothetical protein
VLFLFAFILETKRLFGGGECSLRDGIINALQAAQLCTSTAPAESAAPAASVDDKRRRLHPAGGLERSGSPKNICSRWSGPRSSA